MQSVNKSHSRFVSGLALRLFSATAGVFMMLTLSASAPHAVPVTITVTSISDSMAVDGVCTLREAIVASNTNVGSAMTGECAGGTNMLDTINFSLGALPIAINLSSTLPPVVKPVIINGTGGGRIRIRGTGAGTPYIFDFAAGSAGSKLIGLVIAQAETGVLLQGGSVTLMDNRIGTNSGGSSADGVNNGIVIESSSNVIGLVDAAGQSHGNLISGAGDTGILILSGSNNVIQANLIGTTATGSTALPNTKNGIRVGLADKTTIGGTLPKHGNVISGNGEAGISLRENARNTKIMRNKIGTDITGMNPIPNSIGIRDGGTIGTIIGGKMPEASNLISSNDVGIEIEADQNPTIKIDGNLLGLNSSGGIMPGEVGIYASRPAKLVVNKNFIAAHTVAGINLGDSATLTGSNNCFAGNDAGAVLYAGTATQKFAKNFWTSPSGPGHATNPGGTGDPVADHITFKPFLTTRPASCYGWAASGTSPKDNTFFNTTSTKNVTIKWKPVKTSSGYNTYVNGIPVNTTAASVSLTALPFGKYNWSVETLSNDGVDWFGPLSTFYVTIMKSPKPGATVDHNSVKFTWMAYPGAESYHFELYQFANCVSMIYDETRTTTNVTMQNLPPVIAWRVTPDNGPTMPCWNGVTE